MSTSKTLQMKTMYYIKKPCLLAFVFLMLLTTLSAQKRYKHIPRIRIEKNHSSPEIIRNTNTPLSPIKCEVSTEISIHDISPDFLNYKETPQIINENTPFKINEKVSSNKQTNQIQDQLSERTGKKYHLEHTKDAQESKLVGFILWFLIMLILAIILIVLAIILLTVLSYSFWLIFMVIGAVTLVVAILLLILEFV